MLYSKVLLLPLVFLVGFKPGVKRVGLEVSSVCKSKSCKLDFKVSVLDAKKHKLNTNSGVPWKLSVGKEQSSEFNPKIPGMSVVISGKKGDRVNYKLRAFTCTFDQSVCYSEVLAGVYIVDAKG